MLLPIVLKGDYDSVERGARNLREVFDVVGEETASSDDGRIIHKTLTVNVRGRLPGAIEVTFPLMQSNSQEE